MVGARALVAVLGVFGITGTPSIELTITEDPDLTSKTDECPYLVSLPAWDSLCVAADHLAHHRGYQLVKFHVVRDATSKRLAVLGCADPSCSAVPLSLPAAPSEAISLVSSDFWSCCAPSPSTSYFEAPQQLLSSLELPAACYRVQCVSPSSAHSLLPPSSSDSLAMQSPRPAGGSRPAVVLVEHQQPMLPWRAGQQLGEQLRETGILEFVVWKFGRFSQGERVVFLAVVSLFVYLSLKGYWTVRNRRRLHQQLLDAKAAASSAGAAVSRTSEEVEQPFEVTLNPGEGDSVEFHGWQGSADLEVFNKKLAELKHRVTKLPFAHAGNRDGEREGVSVVFLGRNVDEPKLVFRNPRVERDQRANIPVYTQAVRNALVASILRDTPGVKAYVPRAVVGEWNKVEGVFQEFVPLAKSVSLQDFKDAPNMALDLALLVLLLRDTDAHEGNYARDPRRKVALYDLGCSLGDRPLPSYDRECLDNFELLHRLPSLLDVAFEERHVEFLRNIDFSKARDMWTNFKYDNYLIQKTEKKLQALRLQTAAVNSSRVRANSSVFPLSAQTSPRSIPAFFGGLLSPRSRPVDVGSGGSSSTSGSGGKTQQPGLTATGAGAGAGAGGGGSQLGSPKSTRSLPTSEFFPTGWESSDDERDGASGVGGGEENSQPRLASVLDMVRVMEMHAKFLLRCAEEKKTMLFAAKVMYSGYYDEKWLELGGRMQDLDNLETELLKVASSSCAQAPAVPHLDLHVVDDLDLDLDDSAPPVPSPRHTHANGARRDGARQEVEELVLVVAEGKDIQ